MMRKSQTRRRFLANAVWAGAWTSGTAALFPHRLHAAEPALETTTLRLAKIPIICFAPQYVCEELLRTEGFSDIRYVDTDPLKLSTDLGRGKYDFCANVTPGHLVAIDAGASITIVSGVHAGCYELFAQNEIRGIA